MQGRNDMKTRDAKSDYLHAGHVMPKMRVSSVAEFTALYRRSGQGMPLAIPGKPT
jgi:hypothetical protein